MIIGLLGAVFAGSASAQSVALAGKLQIGFGDANNVTGFRSNNAIPICAGQGMLVNPATVGTTLGTLPVFAIGEAVPGVGGTITFHAVGGGNGGAIQRDISTCAVSIPGFANPRLRSRTQVGRAHWPGRKGDFTNMVLSATTPASPTATYMLSAGGGWTQAPTVFSWTTTNEGGPVGTMGTPAPTAMNTFMGGALERSVPFYGTGIGRQRIQPGDGFGGGVPFSGGGGVQLGINTTSRSSLGRQLVPTFIGEPNFGHVEYANGFLPMSPLLIGTDAVGVHVHDPVTSGTAGTIPATYDLGLIFGRQDATYAFRTPGGSTQHQHGAIRTFNGGNTVTPRTGAFPPGMQIVSPVAFSVQVGRWTTGAVTHTDQVGDFRTVRKASGYDLSVMASTAVAGETRRIQVVTPFSATIRRVGTLGIPIPALGFGGIAKLRIDVIPAPEPTATFPLLAGASAIAGLARRRR